MTRILALLLAAGIVAGCGGNPLDTDDEVVDDPVEEVDPDTEVDPTDPNVEVSSNFLFDPARGLTMNSVEYDADNNQLLINNLPFDGPFQEYTQDRDFVGVPVYKSLEGDPTRGQVLYYAVFLQSDFFESTAALGRDWGDFGYGGANINRSEFGSLPAGDEYIYVGDYAAVRVKNDRGGLQLVRGDARILLDILDFDPSGTIQGAIVGDISNRIRIDADSGAGLTGLPDVELKVISFVTDTGVFNDGTAETLQVVNGDLTTRDTGTFTGMLAGPDGEEMAGHVIIEGPGEIQDVQFAVETYTYEEIPIISAGGLTFEGEPIEREVTISGFTGQEESVNALVDQGLPVSLLEPDRSELPDDAELAERRIETVSIQGKGNAREIGVFTSDQVARPD